MGRVAVEHRGVAGRDLARVVQDDDLGGEVLDLLRGVLLRVGANVATADVLDGNVLHVKSNVVTGDSLGQGFVMHLDGFHLGGDVRGGEGHDVTRLHDAGLDTADGHGADTADLVHVLQGQAQRLVRRAGRRLEQVERLQQRGALVPVHARRLLDHVVALPAGDRHEADLLDVVADLLEVLANVGDDLVVARLGEVDRVHLVARDDHLLHAEGEGEQRVLAGLALLGEARLELANAGGNDEDGGVGLRRPGDHVLDEVAVAGGIDDREDGLGRLELPQRNVDGDAALALGLQLVEHPRVLEGRLADLGGLLLELLDGALVDAAALVDQVSSGS